MSNEITLSVCMITYNHENFIRDAIEGVIKQVTDFKVELVIGEDCSIDKTKEICQEYNYKYPGLIILLHSDNNLGVINNLLRTLASCRGKYIAFCEGDDYWIDSLKLQKQVDLLESNPNYSLCFHNAIVKYEGVKGKDHMFIENPINEITSIKNVIRNWYIPSASMVFRSESLFPLPNWFNEIYNGDYAIQLILALKGEFYCMNQIMSVYRQHRSNLTSTVLSLEMYEKLITLLKIFNGYSNNKYTAVINFRIRQLKRASRLSRLKTKISQTRMGFKIWTKLSFIFHLIKRK